MSPFWSRKERSSRAEERRRELVERERRRYERERAAKRAEPDVEPEAEAPEAGEEAERRPLLPETARRTTRPRPRDRKRKRRGRRRLRPGLGGLRTASGSGARATVRHARPGARRLAGGAGRLIGWLLAWVMRLAGLVERVVLAVLDTLIATGERLLAIGERELTPKRMLVFVIVACSGLLIYSQFVAYRGVEVGQPDYSSVSSIAPAPQTDRVDAGAAHAYLLIPVAVLSIAIAVTALITGRWKLGRLVALLGLVGIAVSLAIDLPKGLDAGTAGTSFAGAHATLTEGFYAQIFASAVLVLCGWALAAQLRGSSARERGTRRRKRPSPRAGLRRALGRLPRRRRSSVAGGGA